MDGERRAGKESGNDLEYISCLLLEKTYFVFFIFLHFGKNNAYFPNFRNTSYISHICSKLPISWGIVFSTMNRQLKKGKILYWTRGETINKHNFCDVWYHHTIKYQNASLPIYKYERGWWFVWPSSLILDIIPPHMRVPPRNSTNGKKKWFLTTWLNPSSSQPS